MAEKKDTKKKAAAKKPAAKKEVKDDSRPAKLCLRNQYGGVWLDGRVTVYGRPDGLRMHGEGHRVTSVTDDLVMLMRPCVNPETEKQVYLDNGWKESK